MPNTKIVATLGPASDSPEIVRRLLEAGADVFRMNASHGTQDDLGRRIRIVRAVAEEMGIHAGILLDLQGPKIRLGTFENGRCDLVQGQRFSISVEPRVGNQEGASTSYSEFARDVKEGDRVLLNDGVVELRVLSTDGTTAVCEVLQGGPIGDRKGINLPGVQVSTPSLTRKDKADLIYGLEQGIDFVALSFVRQPQDVLRLRLMLEERDSHVQVIAKIEKPEAWQNLDAILNETDGVMVARGDLGVEMALEKVPHIQKSIIEKARDQGKYVITATQMLESMIEHATPTRAEVSDVANAIYDGTDAIMLSAETSTGRYPVEAVRMMDRIAAQTEVSFRLRGYAEHPPVIDATVPQVVADAAYHAARNMGAVAIVVFTAGGASARLVAKYRPPVPVYAFTMSENVARQMQVLYGVTPIVAGMVSSTDAAAVFFLLRVGGAVVRDRVRSTLEIESGTNDPMAIFLTTALLSIVATRSEIGGWHLLLEFLREMGLGGALGVAGGWAIAALLRRLPLERALVPLLATSLALCLFAATNMLGGSGYLAVYLAGLVVGNARITEGVALRRFQGAFTWLGQIVMFITLGLFATPSEFVSLLGESLALAAVLVLVARPLAAALCLFPFGFSREETLLTGWVGLRGAVSLLLAILPLLAGVEHARTMFNVTFEIVLVSLLVQGWTLVPVARWLRQVVPARSGPVERNALDMPGLDGHELVCYRIAENSPIAAGATLPRWSRPSLVVRRGESMRIREAGPLQVGDLVYLIVTEERIALLDRIFAATRRPEKSDRQFFGDFALAPDVTLSDIAASYGVAVPLRDSGLTVSEALAREFDSAPTVGDRLRLGKVELIVRDVGSDGRVAEVGLALKP